MLNATGDINEFTQIKLTFFKTLKYAEKIFAFITKVDSLDLILQRSIVSVGIQGLCRPYELLQ